MEGRDKDTKHGWGESKNSIFATTKNGRWENGNRTKMPDNSTHRK